MRRIRMLAFAGASLLALSTPAFAQSAAAPSSPTQAASGEDLGDIVVTARRREERLQDVPRVVNAVSSEDLRKNNIQKFDDVANIVPGITLQNSGNGLVQNAGMRGASFDVDSGLPSPTVQFYLNDANIQPNFIFQSLYDIGQIEVLRGPQGTLRGRSAPSGSITVTTKLPDLESVGGYVEGTLQSAVNEAKGNYALNVPIITDRLAIRVAGTVDASNGTDIDNIYRDLYPKTYNRTWGERVSIRAKPIDTVDINLTYQRHVQHVLDNLQTASLCVLDPRSYDCANDTVQGLPVSGPTQVVRSGDRLSTVNGQRTVTQADDVWNGRIDWHVFGQTISYVGQYAVAHLMDEEPQDGASYFMGSLTDPTKQAPGTAAFLGTANPYQKVAFTRTQYQSHEVRIANETRIAGLFDYVVGYNTVDSRTNNQVQVGGDLPQSLLRSNLLDVGENGNTEVSWFGNLTAHLFQKLELSGGARYIIDKQLTNNVVDLRASHWIWTASASYHFSPDIMGYVNAGSSYRQFGQNLGLELQPQSFLAAPLTNLPQYSQIKPETSKSYEIGFKTQFFDRRLTLNIDYYHQVFHNYQYVTPDYIYFMGIGAYPGLNLGDPVLIPPVALGTINVPAKVDGIEGDFNYSFARDANIGGSVSYADGRVTGGAYVPCPGLIADLSVTNQVNTCPGGAISNAPRFSATLHVDYARPINDRMTGFIREQTSIYGATPNSAAFSPLDKVPAYALVNLFVGVRSPSTNWEVTLFVKNLLNNQTPLQAYGGNFDAETPGTPIYGQYGPYRTNQSNYAYITTTPPREFGITFRYAFGSR